MNTNSMRCSRWRLGRAFCSTVSELFGNDGTGSSSLTQDNLVAVQFCAKIYDPFKTTTATCKTIVGRCKTFCAETEADV